MSAVPAVYAKLRDSTALALPIFVTVTVFVEVVPSFGTVPKAMVVLEAESCVLGGGLTTRLYSAELLVPEEGVAVTVPL